MVRRSHGDVVRHVHVVAVGFPGGVAEVAPVGGVGRAVRSGHSRANRRITDPRRRRTGCKSRAPAEEFGNVHSRAVRVGDGPSRARSRAAFPGELIAHISDGYVGLILEIVRGRRRADTRGSRRLAESRGFKRIRQTGRIHRNLRGRWGREVRRIVAEILNDRRTVVVGDREVARREDVRTRRRRGRLHERVRTPRCAGGTVARRTDRVSRGVLEARVRTELRVGSIGAVEAVSETADVGEVRHGAVTHRPREVQHHRDVARAVNRRCHCDHRHRVDAEDAGEVRRLRTAECDLRCRPRFRRRDRSRVSELEQSECGAIVVRAHRHRLNLGIGECGRQVQILLNHNSRLRFRRDLIIVGACGLVIQVPRACEGTGIRRILELRPCDHQHAQVDCQGHKHK